MGDSFGSGIWPDSGYFFSRRCRRLRQNEKCEHSCSTDRVSSLSPLPVLASPNTAASDRKVTIPDFREVKENPIRTHTCGLGASSRSTLLRSELVQPRRAARSSQRKGPSLPSAPFDAQARSIERWLRFDDLSLDSRSVPERTRMASHLRGI